MDEVLKSVLKKIVPSRWEQISDQKMVGELVKRLEARRVKPMLVGSIAKGTDLRGDKDIDLFVLFPTSVDRKLLEERGLEIGRDLFNELGVEYEIDYAEHPYVKGVCKGYDIEIVPCYDTVEIRSAVDRSPHHTRYVREKIKERKKLANEVRLLKQFMKSIGVYGAEAKVTGFSGYLAELLVISHGSFKAVVEAVALGWRMPETIDVEDKWDNKDSLKFFFTGDCLIVVDPVDANRNVAAAVSKQKMAEFMHHSREFLKKPSVKYFFLDERKPPSRRELGARMKSRGTEFIVLELTHNRINPNTLYSQLRKTGSHLVTELNKKGFRVMKSSEWTDEERQSVILLELEVWQLPSIKQHEGPVVDAAVLENQEDFLGKYKQDKPYILEDRWMVDIPRKYTNAVDLVKDLIEARDGFGKTLRKESKIKVLKDVQKIFELSKDASYMRFLDGMM